MKRSMILLMLCLFGIVGLVNLSHLYSQTKTIYVTVGTSSMGSPLYAAGNVLSQELNKSIPNMKASARVTAGSIQNIDLLTSKTIEMALGDSVTPKDAVEGIGVFAGKKDALIRGITCIWPSVIQIVVPLSVNSVGELRGKRVAIGARGW